MELDIESTRLLSDFWPHGEVAKAYGIFDEDYGISERANILIDENRKVSFVKVYPMGEVPNISEILDKLG
jgi:alkyl hydroperoxide reductase subunit AhpC